VLLGLLLRAAASGSRDAVCAGAPPSMAKAASHSKPTFGCVQQRCSLPLLVLGRALLHQQQGWTQHHCTAAWQTLTVGAAVGGQWPTVHQVFHAVSCQHQPQQALQLLLLLLLLAPVLLQAPACVQGQGHLVSLGQAVWSWCCGWHTCSVVVPVCAEASGKQRVPQQRMEQPALGGLEQPLLLPPLFLHVGMALQVHQPLLACCAFAALFLLLQAQALSCRHGAG